MKPLRRLSSFFLTAILFLLAEGCSEKNLNDGAPTTIADHVEVIFDWSKVAEPHASTMVLYLYSDEHEVMDHWFNNRNGGVIRSYGGKHTAVCHSNDDPYVHRLRNQHDHGEIEIFTNSVAQLVGQGISTRDIPRAEGTENEPLRVTPSMIYATQNSDINFRVSSLPQTLILYPEELLCRYSVEFVDVENLKNSTLQIDGTISSLAGGYFPGRMTTSSEAVTQSFTLTPDVEKRSLRADFLTFGVPTGGDRPHKISLYIAFKNRTGNFYTFDVSDQINNAPDPRNVNIVIRGLKLPDIPDNINPDTGVTIEVDSWETFNFDLKV